MLIDRECYSVNRRKVRPPSYEHSRSRVQTHRSVAVPKQVNCHDKVCRIPHDSSSGDDTYTVRTVHHGASPRQTINKNPPKKALSL